MADNEKLCFNTDSNITVKELYEWAKENGVENMPIALSYQDGGGAYPGDTYGDGTYGTVHTDSNGETYLTLY